MIQILPHKVEDLLAFDNKISEIFSSVEIITGHTFLGEDTKKMLYNAALDLWNGAIRSNPALEQDYILYKELIDSLKPKDEIDLSRFPKQYGMSVTKSLLNGFLKYEY